MVRQFAEPGGFKARRRRADEGRVKAILTVVVYLCFVLALGLVGLLSPRREGCETEVADDEL